MSNVIPIRGPKDALYDEAVRVGCKPVWYDGIFGWRWHCGCGDNEHGFDQQCSVLTTESLRETGDHQR